MNCYIHPEVNAIGVCVNCGKGICNQCATDVGGKYYCSNCLAISVQAKKTNTLSIVSLATGIIGLPLYFCYGAGLILSVAALITGIIGRKQIRESGGSQEGDGMAIAGLILGGIPMVLFVLAICIILILTLFGPVIGNVFSDIITGLDG
jgi:hypothetical protein